MALVRIRIKACGHGKALCIYSISKALDRSLNLSDSWRSSQLPEKLRLQTLMFPDGIGYDRKTDRVRTLRVNALFAPIPLLKALPASNKKGANALLAANSPLVPPSGLEPKSTA